MEKVGDDEYKPFLYKKLNHVIEANISKLHRVQSLHFQHFPFD